ncbi:hypothetical protein BKA25_000735 [Actinoalloteichus hymeniacidonis]|uniref:Uncharacterized protein n=1 Tax=Actinoalloteichus hymeniacidonis TaxID=340345 RepID=A0AAC9HTW2_9PSEU|nr:hypothetical protein TL08_23570 [Actinoalloteichus hymeniacidonis]MBB5906419.1 hypothetical protein [Actinoalloteichus hymeniacidonis]
MNMDSLLEWLLRIGVPAQVVSIGAEADDTWCVVREDGQGGEPAWEVFWREQGNRYDWARFTNENVACLYLFGRLSWTQAVRGVIGLPADAVSVPAKPQTAVPQAPLAAGTPGVAPVAGQPVPAGQPDSTGQPAPAGQPGAAQPDNDATPPTGIPTFTVAKDAKTASRLDG